MRILAIANQKGGCGKTTTAVNLAVAFARKGSRVLLMDIDPQGHATLGLGCEPEELEIGVYEALTQKDVSMSSVLKHTYVSGVDLAPSNILLSGAELELAVVTEREFILSDLLKEMDAEYDLCIIDCPPSLGMLTLNALVASTDIIVPVQVHYYAMEGLKQLLETVGIIQERYGTGNERTMGMLLTFVEARTLLSRQIQQQMREYFGDMVFDTVIHRSVRLAEAPSSGESVITYDEKSRSAIEYMQLADEVKNDQKKSWTA